MMTDRELVLKAQGIARTLTCNEEPQGAAKHIIGELAHRLWARTQPDGSRLGDLLAAAPASEAKGRCNLYRALPYGTNGWRYAVVRGSQTDFLTADFVDAGEASEYAAHRNALVDQRGDDSLPAASSAAGELNCRGCWELGNNCKKCPRCLRTMPADQEQAGELPDLPEPEGTMKWTRLAGVCINPEPGYSAEQMCDYARTALLRRAARVEVTDEMVEVAWLAYTGRAVLGEAFAKDASCMLPCERQAMRAALTAALEPKE